MFVRLLQRVSRCVLMCACTGLVLFACFGWHHDLFSEVAGRRTLGRADQKQAFLEPYPEATGTSQQAAAGRQHAAEEMPVCRLGLEPHECLADSRRWTRRMSAKGSAAASADARVQRIQAGSLGRSVLIVGSFYGATSLSGLQTWPNQTMPLIATRHVVGDEEVASNFVIEVQIDRPITLFFTGIIIPCMLMVNGVMLRVCNRKRLCTCSLFCHLRSNKS